MRLAAVRTELERQGLDGFIQPRADEYLGEYVPPSAERLAWLTGFTGSAGLAVVLENAAALFVDGRYTQQARDEVDAGLFHLLHLTERPPERWIADNLAKGARLGFDSRLHSQAQAQRLEAALAPAGVDLVALEENLLDRLWHDRPAPPAAPIRPHSLDYAGKTAEEKRREVGEALAAKGCALAVITQPDSIAWLLNVRGGDVPHTPLPLSFAFIDSKGAVTWFVAPEKLTPGLARHLGNGVALQPPEALPASLEAFAGQRVLLDPQGAAAWFHRRLEAAGAVIVAAEDPCARPKACKNAVELEGARAAHRRDGAAVIRFLSWLEAEVAARRGSGAPAVSEMEAAARLEDFRRENALFRDLSFSTISAAGANGALPHYRVSEASNAPLRDGELYLVDSGGQYDDGTTDVTRTIAVGQPSEEMRERFTLVLKGHIALACARFPEGTSGAQLDALARYALWQKGLDFDHGTGHGVGSYLSVHEGPQRIARRGADAPLAAGMILSDEPGYYKVGAYGIRIENLVAVVPVEAGSPDARPMLGFETLTLVPIDRALIIPELLTAGEITWLDAYHARVRETLTPNLDCETAEWLEVKSRPLAG